MWRFTFARLAIAPGHLSPDDGDPTFARIIEESRIAEKLADPLIQIGLRPL